MITPEHMTARQPTLHVPHRHQSNGHAIRRNNGHSVLTPKTSQLPKSRANEAGHFEKLRHALLRVGRGSSECRIAVQYRGSVPSLELSVGKQLLLSGLWTPTVAVDGQPLALKNSWKCVCWHADRNAQYLELQCTGNSGLTLERQILLPRRGDFALLADVINVPQGQRIDYAARWTLPPELTIKADRANRECRLHAPTQLARLFPLALPQDRVIGTAGSFAATTDSSGHGDCNGDNVQHPAAECLELKQSGSGRALYAPLVIDWHPERHRLSADWRTLTVTEDARILRPEQASGQRLRIGDHQILVYRSLIASLEPRALLGHQTRNESVVGRFTSAGDVKAILEIESTPDD